MAKGGGNSTTTSQQVLGPEQKQLLSGVIPAAENYMNTPLQQFGPSAVAGFNPTQDAARADIAGVASGTVAPLAAGSIGASQNLTNLGSAGGAYGTGNLLQAGQQGTQGLGDVLSSFNDTKGSRDFLSSGALLDPANNPVLAAQSNAAIRPITENLSEKVLPGIRSDFVGNNMFGSSRQGISEGRAIGDYLKQAGDITTNLQANNFNQGLGAMLSTNNAATGAASSGVGQGLGAGGAGTAGALDAALKSLALNPSLAQLAFLPGMTMEGIGQSEQNLAQSKLSEESQKFSTEQMLPFMQAQDVANLAFGIGGGGATSTAQQNPASFLGIK